MNLEYLIQICGLDEERLSTCRTVTVELSWKTWNVSLLWSWWWWWCWCWWWPCVQ